MPVLPSGVGPVFRFSSDEGHGGPHLRQFRELVGGAAGAEPVVELGCGDGGAHEVPLRLVTAEAFQLVVGDVGLDAFGYQAQAEDV